MSNGFNQRLKLAFTRVIGVTFVIGPRLLLAMADQFNMILRECYFLTRELLVEFTCAVCIGTSGND